MGVGEEHLPQIEMPIRLKASDHLFGGDRQVKDLPPRGGRAPMERLQSDEQPLPRFKSCHLDHIKKPDAFWYPVFIL